MGISGFDLSHYAIPTNMDGFNEQDMALGANAAILYLRNIDVEEMLNDIPPELLNFSLDTEIVNDNDKEDEVSVHDKNEIAVCGECLNTFVTEDECMIHMTKVHEEPAKQDDVECNSRCEKAKELLQLNQH